MPVFQLSDDPLLFPNPEWAREDGLLAVGGDLSPQRLIRAYQLGIFPWYNQGDPILWWSPDPRCVMFPDEFHTSRRLARSLKRQPFRVTCNQAFDLVIDACAAERLRDGQGTWLNPDMQSAYQRLHRMGFAHSIEAWIGPDLVGGLYGLAMSRFFFGESMFHRRTNASKAVLAALMRHLGKERFCLLDCQVPNEHLFSMGARTISRGDFLALLGANPADRQAVWPKVTLPAALD
ncbi:MAG: leucyl/phenylalanyl-tRNA--protein transferase, partial [Deltaproteobacteria bacterium]|nr:leucyl/phenylalanyl-tRNA--protein transferase [Deltaproteobacteria bacterium]